MEPVAREVPFAHTASRCPEACETGTTPGSLDSTQVEQEHSQRLDSFLR